MPCEIPCNIEASNCILALEIHAEDLAMHTQGGLGQLPSWFMDITPTCCSNALVSVGWTMSFQVYNIHYLFSLQVCTC